MTAMRVRYVTGDRWASNVGGYRATGGGRSAVVRFDPALGHEENARRAADRLAGRLGLQLLDEESPQSPAAGVYLFAAVSESDGK